MNYGTLGWVVGHEITHGMYSNFIDLKWIKMEINRSFSKASTKLVESTTQMVVQLTGGTRIRWKSLKLKHNVLLTR